jgi:hypothetical protein
MTWVETSFHIEESFTYRRLALVVPGCIRRERFVEEGGCIGHDGELIDVE